MNTRLDIALSIYVTRLVQESTQANLQVPKPGTVSQKCQFLQYKELTKNVPGKPHISI